MNSAIVMPDPELELLELLGIEPVPSRVAPRVIEAFVGRFERPTALQKAALESFAGGASVLLVAPTASGKTEAGVMPLVVETLESGGKILYVAPTKALINDLRDRLRPGFSALGLTVEARHGDSPTSQDALSRAACIVTTPESIEAALERGDSWLGEVRRVFLDELHAFVDTPRGIHVRVLLTRLRQAVGADLRLVAVSATVPDRGAVAHEWGRPGPPLTVLRQKGQRPGRLVAVAGGLDEIRSWLSSADAPAKVLLFANSRRHCDELFLGLRGASDHVVMLHYSNLEAGERSDTETLLRRSRRAVCVATSTLELGIDVGDIDAVALADAPWSSLSLVQRVGRGGRRSGQATAQAFVADDRTLLRILAAWSTDPNEAAGDGLRPRFSSVAIQQTIELILASQHGRIRPDRLAAAFADTDTLGEDDAVDVVEQLRRAGILVHHALSDAFEFAPNTDLALGRERWGNFPKDRASWVLSSKGRAMSAVEFDEAPGRGDVILFGGRMWRVTSIVRRRINVLPSDPVKSPIRVRYSDAAPLVPASLARRMAAIVAGGEFGEVELSAELARRLEVLRDAVGPIVRTQGIPLVSNERGLKLLTFAGTRANLLMSLALPGAARVDDLGIEVSGPLPSVQAERLVPAYGELLDAARRSSKRLAGYVSTTRWHEYLPPRLQRDEVVSQLDGPRVQEALESVRQRRVVPLELAPTSL